ncbi:MAG: hypothetical protein ABSF92_03410 [Candidatus Acidiferrales bacterium]
MKDTKIPPEKCRAKRHMSESEFVTYDTMLGLAKSDPKWEEGKPLECYARLATICNYSNQSEHVVRRNAKCFVERGWLVPLPQLGSHGSNRYRIVEHDDHPDVPDKCPPYRYDPKTGEELPGRSMPFALFWERIKKLGGFTEDGDIRKDAQFGWDMETGQGYIRINVGSEPGLTNEVNPRDSQGLINKVNLRDKQGLKERSTLAGTGSQPSGPARAILY